METLLKLEESEGKQVMLELYKERVELLSIPKFSIYVDALIKSIDSQLGTSSYILNKLLDIDKFRTLYESDDVYYTSDIVLQAKSIYNEKRRTKQRRATVLEEIEILCAILDILNVETNYISSSYV